MFYNATKFDFSFILNGFYPILGFRGPLAGALQEVDLPIVQNSLCEAAYANTSNRVNSDIHMCAGYQTGGKDACQGSVISLLSFIKMSR